MPNAGTPRTWYIIFSSFQIFLDYTSLSGAGLQSRDENQAATQYYNLRYQSNKGPQRQLMPRFPAEGMVIHEVAR